MKKMIFSVQDIQAEIHAVPYADGSWGFEVRYWLFGPKTATTYYLFQQTFPTKKKMMDFAVRAAQKHFRDNSADILGRLAKLAE